MARKKSRFLQTPIEPFTVEPGLTADQLLLRMERISFQGRMLATAHRVWHKMLEDDVTIFLGMAGALSAGGLRMIVAYLIANRYVDCLVSTGANLYHDLHETRGQHHYIGSPHPDDSALAEDRIDRVYDTYASEEEFISNDSWIADFAATLEPRPYTSREFLHQLGGHLWKVTGRDGILTAAYRANVPIFCPAIADSSIGMGLSQARQQKADCGHIDIIGDIVESANLIIRRPRTASVVLGQSGERAGGVLQPRRQRPQVRHPDRDRRPAFWRRVGIEPRRGGKLGQACCGFGARRGPRRRHHCPADPDERARGLRPADSRAQKATRLLAGLTGDDYRRPDRSVPPIRGHE